MTSAENTYREALRALLKDEVYPYVADMERDAIFPREVVRSLGQKGFFAPCIDLAAAPHARAIPLHFPMFRILIEELAKTQCFGLTLTISMHVGVFMPLVARLADVAVREQVLTAALRGECLGTLAATELAVAGSDFMGMETTAQISADQLRLDGQKHYITNAAVADYVIVFAHWRPGRHFTNVCALLVPTDLPGIQRSRLEMAVMKTAVISQIAFDRVELAPHYLLGRKEFGMRYFLEHIAVERLSGGIWAVAVAEQCLEEAQRAATERVVGEETLWGRGAVRHKIAQAVVQTTVLRGLVDQVLLRTEQQRTIDPFDSAVIKAAVAPAMELVIGTCLQLQGAHGLEAHSPLVRLLNDFRVFGVAGGSTETMLDVIADLWAERAIRSAPA
jgi:alkylation response protein AidB-like acyl-CoA dehydrogenase